LGDVFILARMNLLPFGVLPAFAPRQFVPANANLGDWSQLAPLLDQLESRASRCESVGDFERWLLDWGELSAALDEESSRRYIAMTCHTDSAEAKQAYLDFVEHIEPQLKPRQFKLSQMFLDHPARTQLPMPRYAVFDRDMKVHVELFRPENVPLETEETKLGQQYQELTGSLTVKFRGEEKTLPQMGKFLEEPDRALRQDVWQLVANRRLQEREKFEDFFDQMVKLREEIATNAGFANYLDYAFRARGRFDYTPADCRAFHAAVETEIMPVVRELQEVRCKQLKLSSLQPWDMEVEYIFPFPPYH
jgi:oligoendopeptidase F